MKMQKKISRAAAPALIAICALAVCAGCKLLPPRTVDYVDISRYAGLWYEIARYPTDFDENAVAVTAQYTLNDNGTVHVLNRGLVGSLDGPETSIEGTARVVNPRTNAKLAVRFDRESIKNFEFPYWIIDLGADYDYAVVSNPSRSTLYILNRTPSMDQQLYNDILSRLAQQGYDTGKIELTPQPAQ